MKRIGCSLTILFAALLGCQPYEIEVTIYDPDRAYNGYTFFGSGTNQKIIGVNMEGEVLWDFQVYDSLQLGEMAAFEVQEDGTMLFIQHGVPRVLDLSDYSIPYEGPDILGHHDITLTPMRTILCPTREAIYVDHEPWRPYNTLTADVITELDMASNEIIWEWHLGDYIDPIEHHHKSIEYPLGGVRDWSHVNTVQFFQDYVFEGNTYDAVLFNSRQLNTFWVVDYATSEILWSCGEHGILGSEGPDEALLFSHSHQVELLSNGNVMMYDNGNDHSPRSSRALELHVDPVAQVVEEAWSWTEPGMFDFWGGAAKKLPNGNVILTNVGRGRIIEITPSGEIVWEMFMRGTLRIPHAIYSCDRVPYE